MPAIGCELIVDELLCMAGRNHFQVDRVLGTFVDELNGGFDFLLLCAREKRKETLSLQSPIRRESVGLTVFTTDLMRAKKMRSLTKSRKYSALAFVNA